MASRLQGSQDHLPLRGGDLGLAFVPLCNKNNVAVSERKVYPFLGVLMIGILLFRVPY